MSINFAPKINILFQAANHKVSPSEKLEVYEILESQNTYVCAYCMYDSTDVSSPDM